MPASRKLDLYQQYAREYVTPRDPALVAIGPAKYLTIAGRGRGGDALFQQQVGALYGTAWTIKMASKFAGRDYAVGKLEGLWWGHVPARAPARGPARGKNGRAKPPKVSPKDTWSWRLMIRVPTFVRARELAAARDSLAGRGKDPMFRKVKLEILCEGRCVQALHVGAYHDERATIERMLEFARAKRLRTHGRHHEIYLSDPRVVPPARLKTILRHPVK